MKYITDWNKTDEETSIFLQKNEKYYDISITTVKNILYEIENSLCGSAIVSYPSKTIEILKHEDPSRQCRVYENYNSGLVLMSPLLYYILYIVGTNVATIILN